MRTDLLAMARCGKFTVQNAVRILGIGSALLLATGVDAAERTVQTFDDGWQIVITPRDIPKKKVDVPPMPEEALAESNEGEAVAQATGPALDEAEAAPTDAAEGDDKDLPLIVPRSIGKMTYSQAHRAIGFSRAEFDANPSYRHEAAMELIFGKMRPTTVHKYQQPREVAPQIPEMNYVAPYMYPFGVYDFTRGPYSRYQGLFGYRGGYRSMYYLNGGYSSVYGQGF